MLLIVFFQGVWVFTVVYSMPWLFLGSVKPVDFVQINETLEFGNYSTVFDLEGAVRCTFRYSRSSRAYLTYFVSDLLLFYLLPLAISCYLYICIASVLFPRTGSKKNGSDVSIQLDARNGSFSNRYQVSFQIFLQAPQYISSTFVPLSGFWSLL